MCESTRDRNAFRGFVGKGSRSGESECARFHCLINRSLHRFHLIGSWVPVSFQALFAHRMVTGRCMPDHTADIHTFRASVQSVIVFPESLPIPTETRHDTFRRNPFNALKDFRQNRMVALLDRCKTHTTTAKDKRRDTVPTRRRAERVPHKLRIHVCMRIYEPRRDEPACGINRLVSSFRYITNSCNPITVDGNIGFETRVPCAINNRSVANDEIMHYFFSFARWRHSLDICNFTLDRILLQRIVI